MAVVSQVNQNIQVIVGGVDVSNRSISTIVEQNENAIWMATLKALNEDGANYLNSLVLRETVQIKMTTDSNPPTPVDWLSDPVVVTTFVGTVEELSPIMTEEGQVCGVVAFGNGFQFKQLRIAEEVGNILPVPTIAPVYTYDGTIDNWASTGLSSPTGLFGDAPYLSKYAGLVFLLSIGQRPTYTACTLAGHINSSGDPTNNAATIGAFNFQLSPDFFGGKFDSLELHVVGGITQDNTSNAGHIADTVTLTPFYSIDGGITWLPFTNGGFVFDNIHAMNYDDTTNTYFDDYAGGSYGPVTIVDGTGGCYIGSGTLANGNTFGPFTPPIFSVYNPLLWSYVPPVGQDVPLNIKPDVPNWVSNFQVKLCISGSTGAFSTSGGIAIGYMYLYVNFTTSSGYTVRQLVTGEDVGVGIVPNFVNRTLPDSVNLNGLPSGYPTINTDFVVKDDPTNLANLIAYIKYPYEDCLTAIQDIIKYGSALKFLQNQSGYHWIVDVAGRLVIAPTTNHYVSGKSVLLNQIDNVWTLQPYANPLKVKVDMITQQFKTESPVYNYVYVSGQYQFPLNDDFFRNSNVNRDPSQGTVIWYAIDEAVFVPPYGTSLPLQVFFEPYYDASTPEPTIQFQPSNNGQPQLFIRPFNPTNPQAGKIDFTRMMGKMVVPSVNFWLRTGGHTSGYELRLYVDDGTGHPKLDTYFKYVLAPSAGTDNWGFFSIEMPNVTYQRDYNSWVIESDNTRSIFGRPITLDWSDFKNIAYFGFRCTSDATGGLSYFLVRGFSFTGTIIRAMYDSLSINGDGTPAHPAYGCRATTIKDSFAQTDTLSPTDVTSPLALECVWDLQRYRKIRTTGEIEIPLNPVWTSGQQVWVQSEETIPNGYFIHTGLTNPTTSTVGNFGDYFVNNSGSTKDYLGNYNYPTFQLTSITAGPTYNWTATGLNQYKINKWMRITKATHSFLVSKATTRLALTDDLTSSLTVDTRNVYTVTQRAYNPDFQSKTLGSLKSKDDFDLGLTPLALDIHAYMVSKYGVDNL